MKQIILAVLLSCTLAVSQMATAASFIIEDIHIEGLQRLTSSQAFAQLPLKIGDEADERSLAYATRSMFKSGYFEDIHLEQEGNLLLVIVQERPAIGFISLEGNKILKTEDLRSALKAAGLKEGEIFKRATLAQIELELERQYNRLGRYSVLVESVVTDLDENRVSIDVKVNEGVTSSISHINIIGNDSYTDAQLADLMSLKTPGFWTLFTKDDQYSREKLTADLENIRSYYLNKGYVLFNIESTQVAISANKTEVFITINLVEGTQFNIGKISIAGQYSLEEADIWALVDAPAGQVFSRQNFVNAAANVQQLFGDNGFAFAEVQPVPLVNEAQKTVDVQYQIRSGKRTYVRRIDFRGNTRTGDDVLRREMRQMEGTVASMADITTSKLRLQRLGYFTEVAVETTLVDGTDDQLDVEFNVEEGLTADWSLMFGYSDGDGAFWGGSVNQNNFLGTGNKMEASFTSSSSTDQYRFSYLNPYYTVDGVSRGIDLYYTKRDYSKVDVSDFATDTVGAGMRFGYPINDYTRLDFKMGYERMDLKLGSSPATEAATFVAAEGQKYKQFKTSVNWNNNTLNDFWYPTTGSTHGVNLDLTLPNSDLSFYQLSYDYRNFVPLNYNESLVFSTGARVGLLGAYGSTTIAPFFANYYSGGFGSVRGFANNSLGPKNSNNVPLGGQLITTASAELIFPLFSDMPSVRTSLFTDIGNVYTSGEFTAGELRVSGGLNLAWLTPVGPLTLVVANPLRQKTGDKTQSTHITLGSPF
ncbi:outer membrane protein assembly factor BamA [Candidatus Njordibacter sp. Uisw_039]|uniref:outer membrane protein assembly factor BamA n=1 Tax=Candidatus Njordibacter sp. Uisw_039 TaxID=3230972 RepID=UPI003D4B7385